ncbi:hypothetical protein C9374_010684 [Naegleria lovaniensis]|uniref:Uncharacterized protein n=1 Tax=Naegleria lovaniensis TaxID=51637 RepID=A0AA88GFS3_NAELO|nr:uncharacterized protein C9374_010684 [Naegleria lovaniensis]KAG2374665.1 hypothetical protein C9374_010684 [Naegleria lovaniensis]
MIGHLINTINFISLIGVLAVNVFFTETFLSNFVRSFVVDQKGLQLFTQYIPSAYYSKLIHNTLTYYIGNAKTVESVSRKYDVAFYPLPYTFHIWLVIYGGLFLFSFLSVINSNRAQSEKIGRVVGPWFLLSNVLNTCWILAFCYDNIFLAHLIFMSLWMNLFIIYSSAIRIRYGKHAHEYPLWVRLPFTVYLAWITMALLASCLVILQYDVIQPFSDVFSKQKDTLYIFQMDVLKHPILSFASMCGYVANLLNEEQWSATMVTISSVIALWFSKFKRDFIFVGVVLWTQFGIFLRHYSKAFVTLSGGIPSVVSNQNVSTTAAAGSMYNAYSLLVVTCLTNIVLMTFEFLFSVWDVLSPSATATIERIIEEEAEPKGSRLDIEFTGPSQKKKKSKVL